MAQAAVLGAPAAEDLQAGNARLLLCTDTGDTARAIVEWNGEPVARAHVSIEIVNPEGKVTRRLARVTNREGVLRLGSLVHLRKVAQGGGLRVIVKPAVNKKFGRRRR